MILRARSSLLRGHPDRSRPLAITPPSSWRGHPTSFTSNLHRVRRSPGTLGLHPAVEVALLLLVPLSPPRIAGQVVPSSQMPSCGARMLRHDAGVSIRSPFSESSFLPNSRLHEDSRRRLIVAPADSPHQLFVYDSAAHYLATVHIPPPPAVHQGTGIVATTLSVRDSLYVVAVDRHGYQTLYVVDFHSKEPSVVRSYRLSFGYPATAIAATASGTLVAYANIRSRDRAGYPLHLIGPNGEVTVSFGIDVPHLDPLHPRGLLTRIAGNENSFWAAPALGSRLDRYDTAGRLIESISLRGAQGTGPASSAANHHAQVTDLEHLNQPATIAVVFNTIAPTNTRSRPSSVGSYTIRAINDRAAGSVQILDYGRGCLQESVQSDRFIAGVTRTGAYYTWAVDDKGARWIDIHR